MIKVFKYEFESEEYRKNIISPYYNYYYVKDLASKYKIEPHVIIISKEFEYCNYREDILKIYKEILQKIKNIFNPLDNFYFSEFSCFEKEDRLTAYFRIWNELKKNGIDMSFFSKTKCSDEIKYTYSDEIVYRALCQFQWQNIEDYFAHSKNCFGSYFFYSKRNFDLNSELQKLVEEHKNRMELCGNNVFSLEYAMNYFVENDDLLFIVYGDYHIRSFGINIIGNKKMIDELYEKVLKCFENEK